MAKDNLAIAGTMLHLVKDMAIYKNYIFGHILVYKKDMATYYEPIIGDISV